MIEFVSTYIIRVSLLISISITYYIKQGRRMPCPYFQSGYCTSPRLDEPTDSVVVIERCLSDSEYRTCRFYFEEGLSKEVATKIKEEKKEMEIKPPMKPYLPIHALRKGIALKCPYGRIIEHEGGIGLSFCVVLNRYLNKYEVETCNKYWKECPYRSYAKGATSPTIS